MAQWFRCPICGHLALSKNLDKNFNVETFNQYSLGKAHGFKYESIIDFLLIAKVKAKIQSLNQEFYVDSSLFSDFSYVNFGSRFDETFIKIPKIEAKLMEVNQYV